MTSPIRNSFSFPSHPVQIKESDEHLLALTDQIEKLEKGDRDCLDLTPLKGLLVYLKKASKAMRREASSLECLQTHYETLLATEWIVKDYLDLAKKIIESEGATPLYSQIELLLQEFKELPRLTDFETPSLFRASYNCVRHPIRTLSGIYQTLRHPIQSLLHSFSPAEKKKHLRELFFDKLRSFYDTLRTFEVRPALDPAKQKALIREICDKHLTEEQEGMSEADKQFWSRSFSCLQLSAQVIDIAQTKPFSHVLGQEKARHTVEPLSQTQERELAFLSKSLGEKLSDVRKMSPEQFERFTKRYPATRPVITPYRQSKEPPSPEQIAATVQNYRESLAPKPSLFAGWKSQEAPSAPEPTSRPPGSFEVEKAREAAESLSISLLETAEICPKTEAPFTTSSSQSIPLSVQEERLRTAMREAREDLSLPEELLTRDGNKFLNLLKMDQVERSLDLQDLHGAPPKRLQSDRIFSFLQEKAPAVTQGWDELNTLYQAHQESTPFLETTAAKEKLRAIETAIEQAFSHPDAVEMLGPDLIDWLQDNKEAFLMVRSTGAEDSKESANAGGNISRAYVPAEATSVLKAAADVVISYFGQGSLQNRINGGSNPFAEPLKMAVVVQELIGEEIEGASQASHIPISLVVFSNEPLYVGQEQFRIMRVSACYGHGEGVVSNQGIGTDTFLLLQSNAHPDRLTILEDNQLKEHRLAPLREVEECADVSLQKIENPSSLQAQPTLSKQALVKIYRSALLMEDYFDEHATDIEAIVRKGKLYFVQARPVNRKPMRPTFLKSTEGAIEELQAEMIVPGKGSIISIQKAEQVLVANTLEEAERLFHTKPLGTYSLILVSQREPQNSHPVVNFSSLGMPCLYVPDLVKAKALMQKIDANHPLAACTQTARLYLWEEQRVSLNEQIAEGFAVHPANLAISLPIDQIPPSAQPMPASWSEAFYQLRHSFSLASLHPLQQEALRLKTELQELQNLLPHMSTIPLEVETRIEILKQLDQKIEAAFEEIEALIHQGSCPHLQKLFHCKVLETLFAGQGTGIGQYSLLHAPSEIKKIQLALDYQKEFSHPVRTLKLLLAAEPVCAAETFSQWRNILKEIETAVHRKQLAQKEFRRFEAILLQFEKTGILASWISWLPSQQTPLQIVEQLLNSFQPTDTHLITELLQKQTDITSMQEQIDRFRSPTSFAKAKQEVLSLLDRLTDASFLEQVKQASPLTQEIAYKIMEEALTLLDNSLKTLKTGEYSQEEKGKLFKEMLIPYFNVMKTWMGCVDPTHIPHHPDWNPTRYINQVESTLQALSTAEPQNLLPSAGFSVSAALLCAGTAFQRHLPQTLEDMLTLLHQNTLSFLGILTRNLRSSSQFQDSLFPKEFKQVVQAIENKDFGTREIQTNRVLSNIPIQIQRLRTEIQGTTICVQYNVPLRNHAGQIELSYDISSSKIILKGHLMGQARLRASFMNRWAEILTEAGALPLAEAPVIRPLESQFTWEVTLETLPKVLEEYVSLAQYTLDEANYTLSLNQLENRWSHHPQWSFIEREFIKSALSTAREGLRSSWEDLVIGSINFFNELLRTKELGLQESLEAFQIHDRSNEYGIRTPLERLFERISFHQTNYFLTLDSANLSRALTTALTLVADTFSSFKGNLPEFISKILAPERIGKETRSILQSWLESKEEQMQQKALSFFRKALDNNREMQAGIDLVSCSSLLMNFKPASHALFEEKLELLKMWIEKELPLDLHATLAAIQEGLQDSTLSRIALDALVKLVQAGQGEEFAVSHLMALPQKLDSWNLLTLWRSLIRSGHLKAAQALLVVQEALQSDQEDLQNKGMSLLLFLMDLKESAQDCLPLLQKALELPSFDIKQKAIHRLFIMAENPQYADFCTTSALSLIQTNDLRKERKGYWLLSNLFQKGNLNQRIALQTALEGIEHTDTEIQDLSIETLRKLIPFGSEEIRQKALELVSQRKLIGYLLLNSFEYQFSETEDSPHKVSPVPFIEMAQRASRSVQSLEVQLGQKLWRELVSQGFGVQEAIQMAIDLSQSGENKLIERGLALFEEVLFPLKQGYDAAIAYLTTSPETKDSWYHIQLWGELVQSGQAIPQAFHKVEQALQSNEKTTQKIGIRLLKVLVDIKEIRSQCFPYLQQALETGFSDVKVNALEKILWNKEISELRKDPHYASFFTTAALYAIRTEHPTLSIRDKGYDLLSVLIEENLVDPEIALQEAKNGLESLNDDIKQECRNLCEKLITSDSSPQIKQQALELLSRNP